MNTSLTIDMPEVALFDPQELTLKLAAYVKRLATKKSRTKEGIKQIDNWADSLYGAWKDDCSAEEIVADIRASRTSNRDVVSLFD